jgi:hypothetical protein
MRMTWRFAGTVGPDVATVKGSPDSRCRLIERLRKPSVEGSNPSFGSTFADGPAYGRSITDRMLPAGSLNHAIGLPSSCMIPRSSWSSPS